MRCHAAWPIRAVPGESTTRSDLAGRRILGCVTLREEPGGIGGVCGQLVVCGRFSCFCMFLVWRLALRGFPCCRFARGVAARVAPRIGGRMHLPMPERSVDVACGVAMP